MMPVYMMCSYRGMRKITIISKINGDIHALRNELKERIEKTADRKVAVQLNELVGNISIKGDYVKTVEQFLSEKGF